MVRATHTVSPFVPITIIPRRVLNGFEAVLKLSKAKNMEETVETTNNESDKKSTKFTGYHAFYRSVAVSTSYQTH